MELNKNLQNALNTYADNIAIEVENHSLTYTELKNQSLRLLAFLKADKMGGGGQTKKPPGPPRPREADAGRETPPLQLPSNHLILPMQLRLFIPIHKLFPQINNFLRELYRMDNRKNRNYFAEP